jgi:hypothetical protein
MPHVHQQTREKVGAAHYGHDKLLWMEKTFQSRIEKTKQAAQVASRMPRIAHAT